MKWSLSHGLRPSGEPKPDQTGRFGRDCEVGEESECLPGVREMKTKAKVKNMSQVIKKHLDSNFVNVGEEHVPGLQTLAKAFGNQ